MSETKKIILIIGGTGAQGLPIVQNLIKGSPIYHVRVLTRNPEHPRSRKLAESKYVELIQGSANNEEDLQKAFTGVYGAFVNLDGFTIGEKEEVFWGIRCFEIAKEHKVKHYVWGSLDYGLKESNWTIHTGHYDGKGRVATFISAFPSTPSSTWSILTSGPYLNMLFEFLSPRKESDGTYIFEAPLGKEGRVPMISLEDLGWYARWIFDNPTESSGLDLKIATEHVGWQSLAETFTKVTGKPARFNDLSMDEYFARFGEKADRPVAYQAPNGMTMRQNFTGFWSLWRNNVVKRDYKLLDKIHPNRLSLEGWMRLVGYDGEKKTVLKNWEDGHQRR